MVGPGVRENEIIQLILCKLDIASQVTSSITAPCFGISKKFSPIFVPYELTEILTNWSKIQIIKYKVFKIFSISDRFFSTKKESKFDQGLKT